MAIECIKRLADCRYNGGESPSAVETYLVRDIDLDPGEILEQADAREAIEEESPTTIDIYGVGVFLVPRSNIELEPLDDNQFIATVSYGTKTQPLTDTSGNEAADARTRVRIASRTTKITKSLSTINTYDAQDGSTPGNVLGGIINATPDGVEGVDIDEAVPTFTLTARKPRSFFTRTWFRNLCRIIKYYPVNNDAFAGFLAGEVRIVGADIVFTDAGMVEITGEFAVSFNVNEDDPIVVSSALTITDMQGWDYLQIKYKTEKRTVGGFTFLDRVPLIAAIERIYGRGDLAYTGLA